MNRPLRLPFAAAALALPLLPAFAADTPPSSDDGSASSSHVKDEIKALVAEDAKKAPAAPAPAPAPAAADANAATGSPATPAAPAGPAAAPATKPVEGDTPYAADATVDENGKPLVLPKVDVNRRRFNEIDKLLQKQDEEMAAEAKNTDSSEVDDALNDDDVSLSIFGGRSTQYRERVAKERVRLMSFEKDLLEAMAHTKDPAEKAELQKYIDEIKGMRRDLEGASADLEPGPR
jgi:hypothetical protein